VPVTLHRYAGAGDDVVARLAALATAEVESTLRDLGG
jgi:hypothetical protein